jgi:hypothetical protein
LTRILLSGQSAATDNGVYDYSDNGTNYTLTRSLDANSSINFINGKTIEVSNGSGFGGSIWALASPNAIVIGTSLLFYTSIGRSVRFGEATMSADISGQASGSTIKVTFDTKNIDSFSGFTFNRWTCDVAGIFRISASASAARDSALQMITDSEIYIYKNGSLFLRGEAEGGGASNNASINRMINAYAGDYFEIYMFASTTSGTWSIDHRYSWFNIEQVR